MRRDMPAAVGIACRGKNSDLWPSIVRGCSGAGEQRRRLLPTCCRIVWRKVTERCGRETPRQPRPDEMNSPPSAPSAILSPQPRAQSVAQLAPNGCFRPRCASCATLSPRCAGGDRTVGRAFMGHMPGTRPRATSSAACSGIKAQKKRPPRDGAAAVSACVKSGHPGQGGRSASRAGPILPGPRTPRWCRSGCPAR